MNNRSVLLVLVVVLLVGCSAPITTAPHVRAWQPWTRVSGELGSISPLSIQVDYQTDILPGADSLLCRDLEETIGSLLSRRGFEIRDEASSGKAIFASFRTERRDHIRTGMYNRATYRISYAKTDISTTTSTGVAIASLLSSLDIKKDVQVVSDVHTVEAYTHTISIEIVDSYGSQLWKGESTWDTESPDINTALIPAVQMLFSSLPNDPSIRSKVRGIQEGKGENYLEAYCMKTWFSCPAIPFRIAFTPPSGWAMSSGRTLSKISMGDVQDEVAMEAYLESSPLLVETPKRPLGFTLPVQ